MDQHNGPYAILKLLLNTFFEGGGVRGLLKDNIFAAPLLVFKNWKVR